MQRYISLISLAALLGVSLADETTTTNNSTTNSNNNTNKMQSWPLHCDLLQTRTENFDQDSSLISSSGGIGVANSYPVRIILSFPRLGFSVLFGPCLCSVLCRVFFLELTNCFPKLGFFLCFCPCMFVF